MCVQLILYKTKAICSELQVFNLDIRGGWGMEWGCPTTPEIECEIHNIHVYIYFFLREQDLGFF